jgi:hypothetical protein
VGQIWELPDLEGCIKYQVSIDVFLRSETHQKAGQKPPRGPRERADTHPGPAAGTGTPACQAVVERGLNSGLGVRGAMWQHS